MNPLRAIRQKCLDCSAYQPSEVRLCPCSGCALHPFRMGTNPHRKRRELSPEARAAVAARLRGGAVGAPENQAETGPCGDDSERGAGDE